MTKALFCFISWDISIPSLVFGITIGIPVMFFVSHVLLLLEEEHAEQEGEEIKKRINRFASAYKDST